MAGIIAATAIAVGTIGSMYESRRSRKMSEKAAEVNQKRAQLETMKGSVEKIRQAQIAAADVTQMGENQNVGGSDAVLGGVGSIKSQATGDIGFANQVFAMQSSANRMELAAQKHAMYANDWANAGQAVASIAKLV